MIKFGTDKDLDLALVSHEMALRYPDELDGQNKRAAGIVKRLSKSAVPGVLLADEVGKGKTYVALAVAFAFLAKNPKARILILTHSQRMADIWIKRWCTVVSCAHVRWHGQSEHWQAKRFSALDALAEATIADTLPALSVASYDTLKNYGSAEYAIGCLSFALAQTPAGKELSSAEKRRLIETVVEEAKYSDFRAIARVQIPSVAVRKILSWLDLDLAIWKVGANEALEAILDQLCAQSRLPVRQRFELLIVDEAHKLDGTARQRVISRLFDKRFNKCLLVTATPFALSVEQFRKRLMDFAHAYEAPTDFRQHIEALPLAEFSQAVDAGAPFPDKERLEKALRQYMVRATWNHVAERRTVLWRDAAPATAILPTLLLERVIDGVLQSGHRTHIASRRESLCSSWPAALSSLENAPVRGEDTRWTEAFRAVLPRKRALTDQKLVTAVDKLGDLVRRNTKVVVFTQRLETSSALVELLHQHDAVRKKAAENATRWKRYARHVDDIAAWLALPRADAAMVTKAMAYAIDAPILSRATVRAWWKRHGDAFGGGVSQFEQIIGRGRHLPVVVRHDSTTDKNDFNLEKFCLPCAPLILIATPKAQEGIDLHPYCRHVLLFDLAWNPAVMEQRIGRVHRLGGNRKANEKVNVIYCYQTGTYEQTIATRVQQRCEMMRALLGAGQWLDTDRDINNLSPYMMRFDP